MDLHRDAEGRWSFSNVSEAEARLKSDYIEAFPRYLTIFDRLFAEARDRAEFDFVHSLIPVFSLEDAGWNAYETTEAAVSRMVELVNQTEDYTTGRHLKLWLWGHIVEASAPYEQLARLLAICDGGRPLRTHFPAGERGRPQTPRRKIDQLEEAARRLRHPDLTQPHRELWEGDLRNAVFHADYALHGGEVRIPILGRIYSHREIETLVARANAYHDALRELRTAHLRSYERPTEIDGGPTLQGDRAIVIVREGHGAAGLKDAHTREELAAGAIRFRLGIFTPDERRMLNDDPELALVPASESAE